MGLWFGAPIGWRSAFRLFQAANMLKMDSAGAPVFGGRRLVAAVPRAQAKSPRSRPCREQKRQQVGALQTLARPPSQHFHLLRVVSALRQTGTTLYRSEEHTSELQ